MPGSDSLFPPPLSGDVNSLSSLPHPEFTPPVTESVPSLCLTLWLSLPPACPSPPVSYP